MPSTPALQALGVALMVGFGPLGSVPLVGALVSALLSPWLLAAVASLAFSLGWQLLLPVMLLTGYVSYCEVFESK